MHGKAPSGCGRSNLSPPTAPATGSRGATTTAATRGTKSGSGEEPSGGPAVPPGRPGHTAMLRHARSSNASLGSSGLQPIDHDQARNTTKVLEVICHHRHEGLILAVAAPPES